MLKPNKMLMTFIVGGFLTIIGFQNCKGFRAQQIVLPGFDATQVNYFSSTAGSDLKSPQSLAVGERDLNDVVSWFNSELPANTYIAWVQQTRIDNPDPQRSHAEDVKYITNKTPWRMGAERPELQPFLMKADRSKAQIYLRKDSFLSQRLDGSIEDADFYGELFNYDANYIYLRSETFFDFKSMGVTDPDLAVSGGKLVSRSDKFRLFAQSKAGIAKNQNGQRMPGGQGRKFSARYLKDGWEEEQALDIYGCFSILSFKAGDCIPTPDGPFVDRVSMNVVYNFNSHFDGIIPELSPSAELSIFDKVLIISQRMDIGFAARERYYFGYKNNKFYGLIRWDAAHYDPAQKDYITYSRSVGYKLATDRQVGFNGIAWRGSFDMTGAQAMGSNLTVVEPPKPLPTKPPPAAPAPEIVNAPNSDPCGEAGIRKLYSDIFARTPNTDEINFYLNEIRLGKTIKSLKLQFIGSNEFSQRYASHAQFVNQIYLVLLGRVADADGLNFHVSRLNTGLSRAALISQFSVSSEFQSKPNCY